MSRPAVVGAVLAFLVGCAGPAPSAADIVRIPTTDNSGGSVQMAVRVCRPDRPGPWRVVVINHGKSAVITERVALQPVQCGSEAVRWFTRRGYLAVMPVRRGFGATGGVMGENPGPCNERRDYARSALEGARDIAAAVDYATALPGALPDGAVVVGQSAGGVATVAYASLPHPKVAALISMAGGDGGHLDQRSNHNCHPELLAKAMGRFGATARTPMLWIYTENDSFFAPAIATSLRDSFVKAGGRVTFVNPGPFAADGHSLFFGAGGSAIWGPRFEDYLGRVLPRS
jgi:dienelactone hydrolase